MVFRTISLCYGKSILLFKASLVSSSVFVAKLSFCFSSLSSALLSFFFPSDTVCYQLSKIDAAYYCMEAFLYLLCHCWTFQGDGSACSCHSSMQPESKVKLSMLLDFCQISLTCLSIGVTCLKLSEWIKME